MHPPQEIQSLLELCLVCLATNMQQLPSLERLPEELVLILFGMVVERGKLTPKVLQVFIETGHDAVIEHIRGLKLREPPPRLPGHDKWLHQKPGWY